MLNIFDVETARKTILKRIPPDETKLTPALLERLAATFGEKIDAEEAVKRILRDIRTRGDTALREWSARLDGFPAGAPIRVPAEALAAALAALPAPERQALEIAAGRIREFYRRQPLTSWFTNDLGGTLGQFIRPHKRVGLYVPGGHAAYPSSVLMNAVPARVAGAREVIMVSPAGPGGFNPAVLAAAAIAGVDAVYRVGGAQAVAALAYGTKSIPAVDKIVGPGNRYVAAATALVASDCAIDFYAGPTEIVIVSDRGNPEWIAADLIAQAEHDPQARAILITSSTRLAARVRRAVSAQLTSMGEGPARESLARHGGIIVTGDLREAALLANRAAAEHLVCDDEKMADAVRCAGAIFVGARTAQVAGDYAIGSNHVLPTNGAARFRGGLNTADFVRVSTVQRVTARGLRGLAPTVITLARQEGLEGHARSIEVRLK
jgi:histidinol dehydrogenase